MRAVLVGCAIVAACGGGTQSNPGDGGGSDVTNPNATKVMVTLNNVPGDVAAFAYVAAYQDGDGAWEAPPARSRGPGRRQAQRWGDRAPGCGRVSLRGRGAHVADRGRLDALYRSNQVRAAVGQHLESADDGDVSRGVQRQRGLHRQDHGQLRHARRT